MSVRGRRRAADRRDARKAAPSAAAGAQLLPRLPEPVMHALLIFILAFIVRLLVALAINVEPLIGGDDVTFYYTAARHLARGDGFVYDWSLLKSPNYRAVTDTALHMPGYPATLALVFKFLGESAGAAYRVNAALGAATASLVYLLARRLFGTREGVVAGLIAVFFPGQIYFAAMTMAEVYAAFLVVLLVYLLVRWADASLRWYQPAVLFGLAGLAGLVRAELVLFPLALLGILLALRVPRDRLLALGGAALAGALVFAGLWSLSNHNRLGTWHLTTDVGLVAVQGHNPDTKGGIQWQTLDSYQPPPDAPPSSDLEVQANNRAFSDAGNYAIHHIPNELRLIFPRVYKLIRDDDAGIRWIQFRTNIWGRKVADRMIVLGDAYYFGVLGLALFGAPLWWRSRGRGAPFVLPVVYYLVVFGVFFLGDVRYHMPVVPLTAVPAGATAVAAWEAVRWREPYAGPASGEGQAPAGRQEEGAA